MFQSHPASDRASAAVAQKLAVEMRASHRRAPTRLDAVALRRVTCLSLFSPSRAQRTAIVPAIPAYCTLPTLLTSPGSFGAGALLVVASTLSAMSRICAHHRHASHCDIAIEGRQSALPRMDAVHRSRFPFCYVPRPLNSIDHMTTSTTVLASYALTNGDALLII
nr:hypothetical protein CFP56_68109 [Quercus suber]